MIIRIWSGRAAPERRDAYPTHFRRNVLPELRRLPGFRGAQLLAREEAGLVRYQVLSRWDSTEAIRRFAGEDTERAVVEPEAVAALVDFDDRARHFSVVEDAAP
jgi:heme-degrading monooxygenase HmoA